MTNDDGYLGRRLERIRMDALREAQKAVNRVQSEASGRGVHGSAVHRQCERVVTEVLTKALQSMAKIAFSISGSTSDAAAHQLEQAGRELANSAEWLQGLFKNQGMPGGPPRGMLPALGAALHDKVQHAVDDFRHGMAGEEKLKQDPVVSIVNTVTNSPGTVLQNAVGANNQQSAQQQSLLGALDKLVTSDEFEQLREQDRLAVQDVVDTLRDEIKKPNADVSKAARWGQRLIELTQQLGLQVAAAGLAKVFFGA
jgi:hypothetical protein